MIESPLWTPGSGIGVGDELSTVTVTVVEPAGAGEGEGEDEPNAFAEGKVATNIAAIARDVAIVSSVLLLCLW